MNNHFQIFVDRVDAAEEIFRDMIAVEYVGHPNGIPDFVVVHNPQISGEEIQNLLPPEWIRLSLAGEIAILIVDEENDSDALPRRRPSTLS